MKIISLNSINQLIFVMVKCGVLFEVRTEFSNVRKDERLLQMVKYFWKPVLFLVLFILQTTTRISSNV
jgi:hypothetical protein